MLGDRKTKHVNSNETTLLTIKPCRRFVVYLTISRSLQLFFLIFWLLLISYVFLKLGNPIALHNILSALIDSQQLATISAQTQQYPGINAPFFLDLLKFFINAYTIPIIIIGLTVSISDLYYLNCLSIFQRTSFAFFLKADAKIKTFSHYFQTFSEFFQKVFQELSGWLSCQKHRLFPDCGCKGTSFTQTAKLYTQLFSDFFYKFP